MINTEFHSYLKENLNDQQYEAAMHNRGPILLLAGAGSGKTHTVVCRIARLIGDGVEPRKILALTFTNKAALEMKSRIENMATKFGFDAKGLQAFTFHGFCFNHIKVKSREHFKQFANSKLDTDWDLLELVVRDQKRLNRKIYFPKVSIISQIISKSRNTLKDIEEIIFNDFPAMEKHTRKIEVIRDAYEEEKKKLNYIDFDDLLYSLKMALQDSKYFKASIKRLYEYIIVDEYQDTNVIQDAIVYDIVTLSKAGQEEIPRQDNVMAVGDDSQSIYSFHGADHENILKFPNKYSKTKIIKLEQNYRSTIPILNFANDVINNSHLSNSTMKKEMFSTVRIGDKPNFQIFFDREGESDWIARKIESLIFAKEISPSNIAVLFRAGQHSFILEAYLRTKGIVYKKYGGLDFFSKAHVKDVLAILGFAFYKKDSLSMMRVFSLVPGVGTVKAKEIIANVTYSDNIPVFSEPYKDTKIYTFLKKLEKAIHIIYSNRAPGSIDDMYKIYFEFLEINHDNSASRKKELKNLSRIAKTFPDLRVFYDSIHSPERGEIDKEEDDKLKKKNKVTLSTVHSAKGLEWDIVFVMGAQDESFPSSQALSSFALMEELRLMYVAVTRPKKELYISFVSRILDGEPPQNSMSKLLRHVKKEHYKINF